MLVSLPFALELPSLLSLLSFLLPFYFLRPDQETQLLLTSQRNISKNIFLRATCINYHTQRSYIQAFFILMCG